MVWPLTGPANFGINTPKRRRSTCPRQPFGLIVLLCSRCCGSALWCGVFVCRVVRLTRRLAPQPAPGMSVDHHRRHDLPTRRAQLTGTASSTACLHVQPTGTSSDINAVTASYFLKRILRRLMFDRIHYSLHLATSSIQTLYHDNWNSLMRFNHTLIATTKPTRYVFGWFLAFKRFKMLGFVNTSFLDKQRATTATTKQSSYA